MASALAILASRSVDSLVTSADVAGLTATVGEATVTLVVLVVVLVEFKYKNTAAAARTTATITITKTRALDFFFGVFGVDAINGDTLAGALLSLGMAGAGVVGVILKSAAG